MQQSIFEASRTTRAFHTIVTTWGFQLKTGARCPGLRSNRTFKSRLLADAAGLRMQKSIAQCRGFKMYIHPRKRHEIDNSILTYGYMLVTGPRCGGLLSLGEYKSYELAHTAAIRMVTSIEETVK